MVHNYSLNLELSFASEKEAKIVSSAIGPELNARFEKRSKTSVDINKNVLSLKIHAMDATALKASVNSYMKLIMLCNSFIEEGGI